MRFVEQKKSLVIGPLHKYWSKPENVVNVHVLFGFCTEKKSIFCGKRPLSTLRKKQTLSLKATIHRLQHWNRPNESDEAHSVDFFFSARLIESNERHNWALDGRIDGFFIGVLRDWPLSSLGTSETRSGLRCEAFLGRIGFDWVSFVDR